jgi:high-affinity nickel-transport protein
MLSNNFYKKTFLFLFFIATIACFLLFCKSISMLGTLSIAFMLGLKHGFDADHIVAIDNVTRQLVAKDRASFKTGLFFALGHSTIVFLLTFFIALGFSFSKAESTGVIGLGAIFGTVMSACFLFLTGSINLFSLFKINSAHEHGTNSVLSKLFKPIIKTIDRPYKMYFVGFLFGLGFDTATEIALLGMAAANAINSVSVWYIMLLPMAFALGMIIVDSIDAAMMSKVLRLDIKEKRYKVYNILILCIVIIAAYVISIVEFMSLSDISESQLTQIISFFDDNSSTIGITLVTIFFVFFVFKFANTYSKSKLK